MKNILVVGAGMAGAVVARTLADAGHHVTVVERRDHIAGNCYDYIDEETGVRVHKYGPHIWHTNNKEAHEWFSQFTDWIRYKHQVAAMLPNGDQVYLPINLESVNRALNLDLKYYSDLEKYLETVRVKHDKIENSRQVVEASFGKELCDIFFAPYTKIMWGVDLSELSASVAKRIPMGTSSTPLYFPNDEYQCMPKDGYTAAFEKIFDHPNIEVFLSESSYPNDFSNYDHVFTSAPIDGVCHYALGKLPYRSIKFKHAVIPNKTLVSMRTPTVNFTGQVEGATRVTNWDMYPGCSSQGSKTILTTEYPCDYTENNYERYYPVKDVNGEYQKLYNRYKEMVKETYENVTPIGRMGTYQYLDMWMVICQSLKIAKEFIENDK